jgi:hypothetical protein
VVRAARLFAATGQLAFLGQREQSKANAKPTIFFQKAERHGED